MKSQRATLEVIAASIEEAIEKGLEELDLPREAVEVEILDEGSRGLFGLGTRQARIRLMVKDVEEEADATPTPLEEPAETPEPVLQVKTDTKAAPSAREKLVASLQTEVSQQVVSELLEHMKIKAEVVAREGESDDDSQTNPILVDIHGDDLSLLIGKRSETLNALQYIARQIVSKELGHSVKLVLDVEGYRNRRERQLRQLARRMADQALKTGKKQALEPMPPNERRIIHLELRNNPDVDTQSFGEEPYRKVTIIPKA
ncbi:MAG: protein jag [Anaerolineales bacterium]|nr:protein jag [Anaerolineales bacterium]